MIFALLSERYAVSADIGNIVYCSTDLCALILNALILVNFCVNKKIKNWTSQLFYALVISSLLAAVFNLLGVLQSVIPGLYEMEALCRVFQLLFYVTYNLAGITFFIYSVSLIYNGKNVHLVWNVYAMILCVLAIAGNIMAAIDFFIGVEIEKIVFESVIYGGQLLAAFCGLSVAVVHRKKLSFVQLLNICAFVVLNFAANVIQLLVSAGIISLHVQASLFALAVAVMLIYVTLQRPETEVDPISGMFNMHSYMARTAEKLEAGKTVYSFVFELNNMALINSTFGIIGGNVVIKEMAERVKALLPKNIYLYRLGGSRFAINFYNAADKDKFCALFPVVFEKSVAVNSAEVKMSSTACVVEMPAVAAKADEVQDILKYYRSKAKTADTIFIADAEAVNFSRRREKVEYAIQRALKNRSFMVYYQPIYSIAGKTINSCEALIRLNDPDLGFISPDEFIPIAEETGCIVGVGKFVMEEVCRFIRDKQPQRYGIEFIDVNLSVIQFMRQEIIDDIVSVLDVYGIDRHMVNLEITETASAKSYAMIQSRLTELHSNGFTISLDDFGTGFSTMDYLIKFPFDIVKLDKSIVWAYMSTDKYEPILKHYMPMLHALGMRVVAEGVETKEMLEALERLGCDYIQGYYFSRPVPEEAFLEYVKNYSTEEELA